MILIFKARHALQDKALPPSLPPLTSVWKSTAAVTLTGGDWLTTSSQPTPHSVPLCSSNRLKEGREWGG